MALSVPETLSPRLRVNPLYLQRVEPIHPINGSPKAIPINRDRLQGCACRGSPVMDSGTLALPTALLPTKPGML